MSSKSVSSVLFPWHMYATRPVLEHAAMDWNVQAWMARVWSMWQHASGAYADELGVTFGGLQRHAYVLEASVLMCFRA